MDPEVKANLEYIQIASLTPHYEHGRRNGYFNIYTDFKIMHQSWARPEKEILQKLSNWGHKLDFNSQEYFNKWKMLNADNYKSFRNFHPIKRDLWPSLEFGKGATVNQFISNFREESFISFSNIELFFKNSIFFSRLRSLF